MPPVHEKPLKKIQCAINSISATSNDGSRAEKLEHKELNMFHTLQEVTPFVSVNLNRFYFTQTLVGGGTVYQLTNIFVNLFKKITKPSFEIWKFSFHPNSSKAVDHNFVPMPSSLIEILRDFAADICGTFLPDDLLTDPFNHNHSFIVERLGADYVDEIRRRRLVYGDNRKMIDQTIWQAFANSIRGMPKFDRRTHTRPSL
ncbi:hypothetical protein CAEBREN_04110 [Caenorhabditis brenneri]|uniref:Uncharacterized protein n=1 Tax=Caenorhabditis brenneri TaxID=135651 RepID=G0P0U8_CAEBE|nr:hypothetical protein CAEBREN_04110 [Caenorhabditis brenneri]